MVALTSASVPLALAKSAPKCLLRHTQKCSLFQCFTLLENNHSFITHFNECVLQMFLYVTLAVQWQGDPTAQTVLPFQLDQSDKLELR